MKKLSKYAMMSEDEMFTFCTSNSRQCVSAAIKSTKGTLEEGRLRAAMQGIRETKMAKSVKAKAELVRATRENFIFDTEDYINSREITGSDGYRVTDTGMVYSFVTQQWLMPIPCKHTGYTYYNVPRIGFNPRVLAHRLVAKEFVPNPENFTDVGHKNGIKHDNNASNLVWQNGRKLTFDDVLSIREAAKTVKMSALAKEYDVSYVTIYYIVKNVRRINT